MIRSMIIDDEHLARQRIRNLLSRQPEVEVIGECKSGAEALKAIPKQEPDLIFLDIQMKDMTGFEVLDSLPEAYAPLVIFITAYDQYAIRAFDVFAFDYLLKPFKEERFEQSVENALRLLRDKQKMKAASQLNALLSYLKNGEARSGARQTLPIKLSGKVCFLEMKDIKYVEASGYYIEIHTIEKKYLLRESLTNMEERLSVPRFLRIHRSTIINTDFLEQIEQIGFGDVEAHMADGKAFRVSKTYKEALFEKMGIE